MKGLTDSKHYNDIAKAIKEKANLQMADIETLKASEMAKAIKNIRLGVPVSVKLGTVDEEGHWVRPDYLPNLDLLKDEWSDEDFDGLYMTFANTEEYVKSMGFYISTSAGDIDCSLGHITDGAFVSDYDYTITSNTNWTLNYAELELDDYFVVKITPKTGHITGFWFYKIPKSVSGTVTNITAYNQACVEKAGRLDYITSTNKNSYYYNYTTSYCEREYVYFGGKVTVTSLQYMFSSGKNLQEIFTGWDTTNWAVEYLNNVWQGCYSLQSLDISTWDTSNWSVKYLNYAWQYCYSLQSLDLSGWDTTNWAVEDLGAVWQGCYSLQSLGISTWNTTNWAVEGLGAVWQNCYSLQSLDLSGWDTTNWTVEYLNNVWQNCYSLQSLDLSGWDTTNWAVEDLTHTWESCYSLQSLDLSSFDTSNWAVISIVSAWQSCYSLQYCNIFNITYTRTTNTSYPSNSPLTDYFPISLFASQDYSSCYMLTKASILRIINSLPELTGTTYTLTLGELRNKLTTEEIAIATGKGWTVA